MTKNELWHEKLMLPFLSWLFSNICHSVGCSCVIICQVHRKPQVGTAAFFDFTWQLTTFNCNKVSPFLWKWGGVLCPADTRILTCEAHTSFQASTIHCFSGHFFQVLRAKTAITTLMTVPVTSAKMEEHALMESTPTTASVTQNSQVCKLLSLKKIKSKNLNPLFEDLAFLLWPKLTFGSPTGQLCTEDVDECQLMPNACQNGGTCHNTYGSYQCVCVNGWTGNDCSENIDDCASAACYQGSTCHDRVASFYCECPHGRTGTIIIFFMRRPSHYPDFYHSLSFCDSTSPNIS